MKRIYHLVLTPILLTTVLSGCGSNSVYEKGTLAQNETIEMVEPLESTESTEMLETVEFAEITEPATEIFAAGNFSVADADLNHTYTTRYEEVNFVTYPSFSFDYPDGWTITSEKVTPSSEEVILTNESGATITYWYFGEMRELRGAIRNINSVDVTKVADADFIPGYVQATDYSNLGKFMVARLQITEECDLLGDGESVKVEDGEVRYALLPETEAGEQEECGIPGLPTFSFWYGGHISLIANASKGEFTEQEEKEVISILASFRDNGVTDEAISDNPDISADYDDSDIAVTFEELWAKLKGTWFCEAILYPNQSGGFTEWRFTEHTLKFGFTSNMPCMSTIYDQLIRDEIFYELSPIDAFHYDAYTYKRGSYETEGNTWGDEVRLVWYSFDLSNISEGELLFTRNVAFDNGFIDEYLGKYRIDD